jgi:hypothetical protein
LWSGAAWISRVVDVVHPSALDADAEGHEHPLMSEEGVLQHRQRVLAEACVVPALLVLLFSRCAAVFAVTLGRPLNPDTETILQGARSMRFFYDSGFREPLFAAVVKLMLVLNGDSDGGERALRHATVLSTLLGAMGCWLLLRSMFGRSAGLLALLLFSINPTVAAYSVSGLRDPLQAALSALVVAAAAHVYLGRTDNGDATERRRRFIGAFGVGVLGAGLALTRSFAAVLVLMIASWIAVCAQRPTRASFASAAITLATTILLFLPDRLLRTHEVEGLYFRVFRNLERTGREVGDGPPITFFQYLFDDGNRTVIDVIARLLVNTGRYFVDYATFYFRGYELLWVAIPLGAALSIATRRALPLVGLMGALAPVLFILNINQVPGARGVEMRLVLQAFPFALACAWAPASWLLKLALDRLTQLPPRARAELRAWLLPIR